MFTFIGEGGNRILIMGTFLSSLVVSCSVLAGFSGHVGADPRSHVSQQQQSCCVQKDWLHCLPSWVSSG